ncbi:hypothetical protein RRG08_060031 [Elysia crispata]|uniref:Uncharacterized protein n=1 Tax=Elysia crispata TaxID=231223 RepID=A0AAE1CWX6_9GAST|nr:hypothetical protein RRG08_060031 [Elysia crispata]
MYPYQPKPSEGHNLSGSEPELTLKTVRTEKKKNPQLTVLLSSGRLVPVTLPDSYQNYQQQASKESVKSATTNAEIYDVNMFKDYTGLP